MLEDMMGNGTVFACWHESPGSLEKCLCQDVDLIDFCRSWVLVFFDTVQWCWDAGRMGGARCARPPVGTFRDTVRFNPCSTAVEMLESSFCRGDCNSEWWHDSLSTTSLRYGRVYFISVIVFGNCRLEKLIQFHSNKMVYLWNDFHHLCLWK